jgi:hypothetical protein
MSTRIYRVDITTGTTRFAGPILVRAKNRAQAINLITGALVKVEIASQDDLFTLGKSGGTIFSDASSFPEQLVEPPGSVANEAEAA